ncbi:MAG: hypothetical protein AAB391_01680 [Patescibacteria group bacterium]
MNALLNRALVALVSTLACLTLWSTADVRAADVLPSTLSQIRTAQFAGVNTIEALLYRWPHDYYAVEIVQPIARTNVSVSGLTPEAFTNKLREVAFQMACLATNYPLANSDGTNSRFLLKTTAKEADIPSVFASESPDIPATTLEMAQVNVVFPLVTNGVGGFRLPADATAETIPINVAGYVFLPFPNLRYFDGPPPATPWYTWYLLGFSDRPTCARVFTSNPDGSTSEVLSKTWGNSTINYLEEDPAHYADYFDTDGFRLLRLSGIARIGIHLSLLTNGTPTVLALEAADGTFPKYWLPTGQPIGAPVLTSISLVNGAPKVSFVGIPGRQVVLESATSLRTDAVWTVSATFSLPDQHGMTNHACPTNIGPGMGPLRFLRLREQ